MNVDKKVPIISKELDELPCVKYSEKWGKNSLRLLLLQGERKILLGLDGLDNGSTISKFVFKHPGSFRWELSNVIQSCQKLLRFKLS